ncbi:Uncharacterized conserved protein YbjT, contains NAD(P)-binding and DUF2867 domains [Frankineae bacterium MT45]|nr:Uncharacterized conserved protein YbjT, contains NAD(P)-binding and DUF2867 domains [Frankineae bacterium MT45]
MSAQRVAVAGGTGVVGRHVVAGLRAAEYEPVVISRSNGVDLTSGLRLAEAISGCTAVIDVSNVTTANRRVSVDFFSRVTEHLVAAATAAGVQHLIALSIVGIDDVDFAYYEGKRRQEEMLLASGAPVTIQRATQFHEFAGQMLARTRKGPLALVPKMLTQPVAAAEVGELLASLVAAQPSGRATDFGGPQQHELPHLVTKLLTANGERVRVVPVRIPGAAGKAMATGALTTGAGARISTITFDQWLATQAG